MILTDHFQTNKFSNKDQYDAFVSNIGIFFDVKQDPHKDKTGNHFIADMKSYFLNEVVLIKSKIEAQYFFRNKQMISRSSIDHILIQVFSKGWTSNLKTKDELCKGRKLIVIDTSQPWQAYNPDFENYTLVIPRRTLFNSIGDPHIFHGKILDCDRNPMADILYKYVYSLGESIEKTQSSLASTICRATQEIVKAALKQELFFDQNNHIEMKFTVHNDEYLTPVKLMIKEYIEKNLHDPQLSVNSISKNMGVSRSQLYRLFPKSEGGIMSYARSTRLRKAYLMLTDSNNNHLSIGEIAYKCGFENESSFSRSFKNHFSLQPREARYTQYMNPRLKTEQNHWHNWIYKL